MKWIREHWLDVLILIVCVFVIWALLREALQWLGT